MQPNPGLTAHANATYQIANRLGANGKIDVQPPVAGASGRPASGQSRRQGIALRDLGRRRLRGDHHGCHLRRGQLQMHDSLNPLAGISPMIGMWVNCVFGGKGVGMINLLLFLIVGVFLAGQMVGRTPEYLGRKVGAREMKLAMIALLDASDLDTRSDRAIRRH